MTAPIRLLIAEPQPMLRTGFRTVLGASPELLVVAEAGDGAAALELSRRLMPDVVLLDLNLPGPGGVAAVHAIAAARLPVRVLLLANSDPATLEDDATASALRAGAGGLLAKDTPAVELIAAIRAVAAGQVVLSPALLHALLDAVQAVPPPPVEAGPIGAGRVGAEDGSGPLTEREREVLANVARGLSNAEIATALRVGETTVKTHVGRLLTKLGLRDRVQAVVYAYETGLVRPARDPAGPVMVQSRDATRARR